jgi:hypothetical protein
MPDRLYSFLVTVAAVLSFSAACGPGALDLADGGPDGGKDADDAGDDGGVQPGVDTDGDGLDDVWELAAGDSGLLDWANPDSDGDGTDDGREDYDSDGLTNLEEFAASRLTANDPARGPHPLRRDLLVELDAMQGRVPPGSTLDAAAAAYAALPLENIDGSTGVGVHFYPDELDIPSQDFDGSFPQRNNFLRNHGPQMDDGQSPPLPLSKMIHVVVAARRTDIPDRGGEAVPHSDGNPEAAGVFLYHDVIYELFPMCERPVDPVLPPITPEEMITATLVHEMGHTLQLGHDTQAGGGINYFNIMSVPTSCPEAHMRMHGTGNQDPALGATESQNAPRFSQSAAALMKFENKLSVETAEMEDEDGYEM